MEGFVPGDLILHMAGWRDGGVIGLDMMPNKLPAEALAAGMTPQTFLNNMGLTGGTAWIGLLRVASAKHGATVFVAAAAGAVGSAVVDRKTVVEGKGMAVSVDLGGCGFITKIIYTNHNLSHRSKNSRPSGE